MKKFFLLVPVIFLCPQLFAQTPTWSQNVAPILYAHCTICHHPGSIAPFALLTYNDAFTHASLIRSDLSIGKMPPWPPDTTYTHFVHERVLSTTEINTIQQWISGGKPQGDITLAPSQPTYNNSTQLGTVDLSVIIPTYTVSGTGDVYRVFPIPSGLSQDMYVTAIEVIPGNAQIVHHVLVFQDPTNVPAQLDTADPGPGYTDAGGTGSNASVMINGWAPGSSPYYTPVGTGFRLPANTNIVVQVHYPNGSQGQVDSTRINFKLTSIPQRNITVYPILNHIATMTNGPINIAPNTTKTYYEKYTVPANYTFLSVFPHMHLVGRSIKSWANTTTPGDTIPFINIPNWNFHWQGMYAFPNAIKVPTGSILQAQAYYDNTTNNPDNPNNPPQTITAGEATTDEMMIVFFAYLPFQNGDTDIIIDRRVIPQGATTFCTGQSVKLQTIEGARYTYQWYKNGASINGATLSSYTATAAGNFSVHITLGANSTYSDTVSVVTTSAPTATVTPTGSTTLCPGTNVTLNAATGTGYTYQWFSDTIPVSGATASSYTATAAGSFSVQVYNGCYAKSTGITVTTASAPSTTITPSGATTFCQGDSVTLSAPAGMAYHWSTGPATRSISVSQTGSYFVTVTNTGNCSAVSSSTPVTVNALPTASISNSGATTFCSGHNVTLTAPANLSYRWSNSSTSQSITVSQSGSFTVTVTDANTCSAVSSAVQITVNPLPSVSITAGSATSFCTGGSVTLTASANTAYRWSDSSSAQAVVVSQSGNYTVTVTDANTCSNTASAGVTVYALPDTTITSSKPTSICPGDSVTLSGAAGLSYHWSNGATTQDVTASSNISLTLTVTDTHSCSAVSAPVTVTVSNNATASITPSGPTSFCIGNSVQLTATSGSAYQWSNGTTGQSLTVDTAGTFTVTVTMNGSCIAVSPPQTVVVNPLPTVSFSAADSLVCSDVVSIPLSGGTPAGGVYSGMAVTGSTFSPTAAGLGTFAINYTYTDNNGCMNSAVQDMTVSICTAVNEPGEQSIFIAPNPSKGNFVVDWGMSKISVSQLVIYDLEGKMIFTTEVRTANNLSVSMTNVASSCYILLIKTSEGPVYKKLVIER